MLVRAAALNNADWCDAFCRTHGILGRFRDASWFSPVRTPRYYPDAVTLRPGTPADEVLEGVDTGDGCSVKDSFADLDLAAAGFHHLFEAEWMVAPPSDAHAAPGWSALGAEDQLADWEAAWGGGRNAAGFFRPALLQRDTISVLARREGERIAAGAIAHRSVTAVGLGNLFAPPGELASTWLAAAALARARWTALPVVSYATGEALAAAHEAGFTSIGELIVWTNQQREAV